MLFGNAVATLCCVQDSPWHPGDASGCCAVLEPVCERGLLRQLLADVPVARHHRHTAAVPHHTLRGRPVHLETAVRGSRSSTVTWYTPQQQYAATLGGTVYSAPHSGRMCGSSGGGSSSTVNLLPPLQLAARVAAGAAMRSSVVWQFVCCLLCVWALFVVCLGRPRCSATCLPGQHVGAAASG